MAENTEGLAVIGIRDLARHLEISIGTVSRALNGKSDVNEETRRRVIEAAARLGYTPNQAGRSLRKGSTGFIGILIPSYPDLLLVDAVFLAVMDGMKRYLATADYDLAIFPFSHDVDPVRAFTRVAEGRLVDGLVVTQTLVEDDRIDYLVRKGLPFATFGRSRSNVANAWVDFDFDAAVIHAVDQLAALGHRRIGLVMVEGGFNYLALIADRFRAVLAARGLPHRSDDIVAIGRGEAGGMAATARLMDRPDPPTAIVTVDPHLAAGCYRQAAQLGLVVGHDLSIVSLHSAMPPTMFTPAIATYAADLPSVGEHLGRGILAAIQHGRVPAPPIRFLAPLVPIPGASLGPPEAG